MAFIYKITNDINQKVYIGKTEYSIQKRWKEHCHDYKSTRCEKRPLYNAMNKYGIEHFHIELIEETDQPEEREIYWISYYNSFGKNGYNATKGGDGKHYLDYDQIVKAYQEYGTIKEVSEKLKIDCSTIRKVLRNNKIEITSSQELAKRKFSVPVVMLDKDTEEPLKTFSSGFEAAEWLIQNGYSTSVRSRKIREVCRGKGKTCAGFKWRFTEQGDVRS